MDKPDSSICECDSILCLTGSGVLVAAVSIIAAVAWPERIPSLGWAIMTSLFCVVLIASIITMWVSLRRARGRADELVKTMTEEVSSESSKLRLMDRYNDLGLPVWPLVYQNHLVASVSALFGLIALLGLLAHWPDPDKGAETGKTTTGPSKAETGKGG